MKTIADISEFEQAVFGQQPVVLLFVSEFCPPCTSFLSLIKEILDEKDWDIKCLIVHKGIIPGLEKAFDVRRTPAMVLVSADKKITCLRQCGLLAKQELQEHLEAIAGRI